jgi:hypothetical protein
MNEPACEISKTLLVLDLKEDEAGNLCARISPCLCQSQVNKIFIQKEVR